MSTGTESRTYALLTDGTTIEIRPARPGDFDAVRDMHDSMSADNLYLRFFSFSTVAGQLEARRICREPAPDHAALLAILNGEAVGCGSYEVADGGSRSAEVALAVADDMHSRGVGTLLLEHLISLARARELRAFTAETLTANALMLQVFADAGLQAQRALADGVYDFTFPLPTDEADATLGTYRDAVAERERSANVASLRHVLNPASVAVIGASRRPGSVGRAILANITTANFPGPVYAVNPNVAEVEGMPCIPSAAGLPEDVDLAVITAPKEAVLSVAEQCGQRKVKALAVITSGLGGAVRAELLGICRRHGMRLIGPASFGVANTSMSLDATFAARHPLPGRAGLALQSGGVGVVLLEHLSRLGVGVSSFVSLGDKDDVSGNDMLMWWESDPATKLAVLYLDSFGNPRKFARTARRVCRTKPVLTVSAGRSPAAQRMAAARLAGAEAPLLTRQALLEQAGVIATASIGELIDAAALLASQPVPAGERVAVVSNARGAGILGADACVDAGLQVATLAVATRRALRGLLPSGAEVAGPVVTTAAIAPGLFRRCLELVGTDPGVDAVLALTITTATSDIVPEVQAAQLPVPIATTVMDQLEAVRLLPGPDQGAQVPAYAYPESAARALGHAARYGTWLATPQGQVPDFDDLRQGQAKDLVKGLLTNAPKGGWLTLDAASQLLGCYGVPLGKRTAAITGEAAGAEAAPSDGAEVTISVLQEQTFGPLVLFGIGGAAADLRTDRVARLAPLTGTGADDLIRSSRAAPLLLGRRGTPAADIAALKDLMLRVSRMADELPQIAELDLSVIARPDGAQVTHGRIRIQAAEPADAFLRRLR